MGLDELDEAVTAAAADLGDEVAVGLDTETRNEMALLAAALDHDDPADLLRRGVHLLFQTTVDTGQLDFHLRRGYDVTYDEYLSGMTFEEMTGGIDYPQTGDDARRYQF